MNRIRHNIFYLLYLLLGVSAVMSCRNEADVADALVSGKLSGFGADVLAKEPADPQNPLLSAPHTVITPHCAWTSTEARLRLMDCLDKNLDSFVRTGKGINRVF